MKKKKTRSSLYQKGKSYIERGKKIHAFTYTPPWKISSISIDHNVRHRLRKRTRSRIICLSLDLSSLLILLLLFFYFFKNSYLFMNPRCIHLKRFFFLFSFFFIMIWKISTDCNNLFPNVWDLPFLSDCVGMLTNASTCMVFIVKFN